MGRTKICGVYAVYGPAGVYVGQSVDCVARNYEIIKLGLKWEAIRLLPFSSTLKERIAAEMEVANALKAQGWVVVSCNTSEERAEANRRGRVTGEATWRSTYATRTPARRAEIGANISVAKKGKPRARSWWDTAPAKKETGRVGGQKGSHLRWHVQRGIRSPNCAMCA